MKKTVLVIDATEDQKARYIVPTITPTVKFVTNFEEIDIAGGFDSYSDMKNYLGISEEQELDYDYIFIDTDKSESFVNFELINSEKNYFVTSFDNYSLKKGLEALSGLPGAVSLTKVLFTHQILKEEDDYLNFLSLGYKVIWNEHRMYFPLEMGDLRVIYENHRLAKIKFKRLSAQYKDGLAYMVEEILGDVSSTNIRKTIKMIERGV